MNKKPRPLSFFVRNASYQATYQPKFLPSTPNHKSPYLLKFQMTKVRLTALKFTLVGSITSIIFFWVVDLPDMV